MVKSILSFLYRSGLMPSRPISICSAGVRDRNLSIRCCSRTKPFSPDRLALMGGGASIGSERVQRWISDSETHEYFGYDATLDAAPPCNASSLNPSALRRIGSFLPR